MRNVAKDESSPWEETVRVEDVGSSWDTQTFDSSFFDDNQKIFEWDDSGAVEDLKKAEVKLQQGFSSENEDYLSELTRFSASIDWDTRWLCTLPDCAEELTNREEKRKNLKVSTTRRDLPDNSSAVILGLPEPQDDTGCSGTPSPHLPLNFVPVPTGWGEGDDNPADAQREDSPIQPSTNYPETQVELTSQTFRHAATNDNGRLITGSGWPEQPSSYQHIIPSGWEDVQVDQPVVSSGWGGSDREPRSDIQMHQADIRWCDRPYYGSRPAWSNPHVLAESPQIYGKSHSGEQDLYNKCHKYGYWRPKQGNETTTYESNERKSLHKSGRPIPTLSTGWGEGDDNQADAQWEDSPMQPMTETNHGETQDELTSQSFRHAATNDNGRLITRSGWPEQPSSYEHIIPSGWDDVQVDQSVVSSGWGGSDREPRSDIQMHQADIRWCDRPSYGSRPAWSNPHVLSESPQIYGKSHSGAQDLYNKCHKYGYWRPKRGNETTTYESNGRKSMQRPGRPISTIHRVNYDPRSPRVNRSERSKAQWSTVDNITHE